MGTLEEASTRALQRSHVSIASRDAGFAASNPCFNVTQISETSWFDGIFDCLRKGVDFVVIDSPVLSVTSVPLCLNPVHFRLAAQKMRIDVWVRSQEPAAGKEMPPWSTMTRALSSQYEFHCCHEM